MIIMATDFTNNNWHLVDLAMTATILIILIVVRFWRRP